MRTSNNETTARARNVRVTDDELCVELRDGRVVSVPLKWFPRLVQAGVRQRGNWELLGDGEGVRWPEIDEDLSVAGLLRGTPAAGARPGRRRSPARHRNRLRSNR